MWKKKKIRKGGTVGRRLRRITPGPLEEEEESLHGIRHPVLALDGHLWPSCVHPVEDMELFYIAALIAWLGPLGMGTSLGYSSPAIPSLRAGNVTGSLTITPQGEPWFGSLMTIGALIGGLSAGLLADLLGRKICLIISSIGFTAGWAVIGTSNNVIALCAGRVVTGLFTGLVSLVVPLYISEISRPRVRGILGAGIQLSVTIGILGVFFIGKYARWDVLAFVCILPTGALAVLMLFMVESPRWLLTKGRRDDALKSLQFLYSKDTDYAAECQAIEEVIKSSPQEKLSVNEFYQPFIYKPIMISLFLMFAQQFSGINAVMFYAVSIFEQAHTSIPAEDCMVIIGVVQVAATLLATVVMDKGGRRVMLLLSVALLGTSLFVLGTYHYVKTTRGEESVSNIGWLPLASLSVFIVGFSCGMGPIPWLMMGELLPVRVLGFASSLCTGCNWALAFLVTKEFSYMVSVLDAHGTYWFFAGVMALCFCVIIAVVPETKGKSLEQIEMAFRGVKLELGNPEAPEHVEIPVTIPSTERALNIPNEPLAIENHTCPGPLATSQTHDDPVPNSPAEDAVPIITSTTA